MKKALMITACLALGMMLFSSCGNSPAKVAEKWVEAYGDGDANTMIKLTVTESWLRIDRDGEKTKNEKRVDAARLGARQFYAKGDEISEFEDIEVLREVVDDDLAMVVVKISNDYQHRTMTIFLEKEEKAWQVCDWSNSSAEVKALDKQRKTRKENKERAEKLKESKASKKK